MNQKHELIIIPKVLIGPIILHFVKFSYKNAPG